MTEIAKPKRRRRRFTLFGGGLIGVLLIALGVTWWVARGEVASALAETQRNLAADGVRLDHQGLAFSGFPLQLEASLARPSLVWADGRWEGPAEVTGGAWLNDPFLLRFTGPGSNRLQLGPLTLELESRSAEAVANLGERGLDNLTLAIEDATLRFPDSGAQADLTKLDAEVGPLQPLRDAQDSTSFAVLLDRLTLPAAAVAGLPGLGRELKVLQIYGDLTGPLVPGPAAAVAQIWRQGDGVLDLTQVVLDWGDLQLEASGRLTLDGGLRPVGTLAVQIAGLPNLLQDLADSGHIKPGVARTYSGLLSGLAQPREGRAGRWIGLPLVLRDGQAFLKLPLTQIPLARVPPLFQT
ncbi:MAG: hypothetical protein Kilf2KO_07160 [Rhodospirillales bacterium]